MKTFMMLISLLSFLSCHDSSNGKPKTTLAGVMASQHLPAIGSAVIQAGVMNLSILGIVKVGSPTLMTPDKSFHLGSCTKAMTATLAAILIEEGIFGWDNKLVDLMPEITLHPDFHNATFEMLTSHRSGLSYDGAPTFADDWLFQAIQNPNLSPSEARDLYAKSILIKKPISVPGERFRYTNSGYVIAAYIMETITGKNWEELMHEKLFLPLQMNSCGTGPTWGHYYSSTTILPIYADNPPALSPAAGIHCSLPDWGKFLQHHLDGFNGADGIISKESFKKLHTISANDGQNYTYGGWVRVYRDWAQGVVLTHNGSNTWNYAQVWLAPFRNAILVSATNIAGDAAVNGTNQAILMGIENL